MGKIKASLSHSWVIVTDGHVRSAKTNSSSDKHHGFERWKRKIFARFPIHSWLWKESSLLLRELAPQKEGQWYTTDGRNVTPTERGRGCWIHISSHWAGGGCPTHAPSASPVSHQVLSSVFLKFVSLSSLLSIYLGLCYLLPIFLFFFLNNLILPIVYYRLISVLKCSR